MFKRKRKNDEGQSRRILLLLVCILAGVLAAGLVVYRTNTALPEATEQANAAQTGGNGRIACEDLDGLVNALETGGEWVFNCRAMVYLPKIVHVTQDTTLTGSSNFLTMLSGRNAQEAVIWVENGATLTLNNVHITEATRYGIYVVSGSHLVMDNCRFTNIGGKTGDGAALWNDGTAEITSCVFEYNYGATAISGAVFSSPDAVTRIQDSQLVRNKVGIYSHGALSLDNTVIKDNRTDCAAWGKRIDPDAVCGTTG